MPKIKNKATGKKETVTDEELKTIQENKLTRDLYDYSDTPEPEEVSNLKEKEDAKSSAGKGTRSNQG